MEGRLSDKQRMKQDEPSDIPFGSVVLKLYRLKTLTRLCFVFSEKFQEKGEREADV